MLRGPIFLLVIISALTLAGCEDAELRGALSKLGERSSGSVGARGGMDDILTWHAKPPIKHVASFGSDAVPGLSRLLASGTDEQKWDAAISAALIGSDAVTLEAPLMACARIPATEEAAIIALAHVAPDSTRFQKLVTERFAKAAPPPHVVFAAARVLTPVTPVVHKRLREFAKNLPKRSELYPKQGTRNEEKVKAAFARRDLAQAGAWALGLQGKAAAKDVPTLIRLAPDGGIDYVRALARIDTPPARKALIGWLRSSNRQQSNSALFALSSIDPVPALVWKTLGSELESDSPGRAVAVVDAMGSRAHRLMPKLLPLLDPAQSAVSRTRVLRALEKLGPFDADARMALTKLLKDETKLYRDWARFLLDRDPPAGGGN